MRSEFQRSLPKQLRMGRRLAQKVFPRYLFGLALGAKWTRISRLLDLVFEAQGAVLLPKIIGYITFISLNSGASKCANRHSDVLRFPRKVVGDGILRPKHLTSLKVVPFGPFCRPCSLLSSHAGIQFTLQNSPIVPQADQYACGGSA